MTTERQSMGGDPGFDEWLKAQIGRDDSIGDLAEDASRDPLWPHGCGEMAMQDHLYAMQACDGAKAGVRKAWKEYRATQRTGEG